MCGDTIHHGKSVLLDRVRYVQTTTVDSFHDHCHTCGHNMHWEWRMPLDNVSLHVYGRMILKN